MTVLVTRWLACAALVVGLTVAGSVASSHAADDVLKVASIEALNERGGWHGRPIEFAEYDAQGTTAVAAEKLRAAIADGVNIVIHGGSSAIAGQITEDVRKHNLRNPDNQILFLSPGAEALE